MTEKTKAGTKTTSFRGANVELEIACDLMSRGFYVYRNVAPVGPIDMFALSPEGEVLKVQATTGRLGESGLEYNRHQDTPYWDVIAVRFPDAVRYYSRDGKEFLPGGSEVRPSPPVLEEAVSQFNFSTTYLSSGRPRPGESYDDYIDRRSSFVATATSRLGSRATRSKHLREVELATQRFYEEERKFWAERLNRTQEGQPEPMKPPTPVDRPFASTSRSRVLDGFSPCSSR